MSDITVQFGYVDIADNNGKPRKEPAMGIKKAVLGRTPIYAITLNNAHQYTDPNYLVKASFDIANHLQMFPDEFLCRRICNLILDKLDLLIRMKPYEQREGKEVGEGKLYVDGDIEHFAFTNTGGFLK